MDSILFWLVSFTIVLNATTFYRTRSPRGRPFFILCLALLFLLGVFRILVPDFAGILGIALYLCCLLGPALLGRRFFGWVSEGRFQKARRLGRVLRWIHPGFGWPAKLKVLSGIERAQSGEREEALRVFAGLRGLRTEAGQAAFEWEVTLGNRWEEARVELEAEAVAGRLHGASEIFPFYLRTLGETGRLPELLGAFEARGGEITQSSANLEASLILAFAFAGDVSRLHGLLARAQTEMSPARRAFWMLTARQAAGDPGAPAGFAELMGHADARERAGIERRGSFDLSPAALALGEGERRILAAIVAEHFRDEQFRRWFSSGRARRPWMTLSLIAVNTAVFLLEVGLGGSTDFGNLFRMGALVPKAVSLGEYWRLGASTFLHIGIAHLLMNMLGLYWLGGALEALIGPARFALCYFISGVGSMAGVVQLTNWGLLPSDSIYAGASGAIMGLVGALGAIVLRAYSQQKGRAAGIELRRIGTVVLFQSLFDVMTPQVSMSCHLLGVVTGFASLWAILFLQPSLVPIRGRT